MTTKYQRWDREQVEQLLSECTSLSDVCRRVGKKPVGGTLTNLKLMCNRWGLDTSHFTGQGWKKGKPAKNRKPADLLLVYGSPNDHRLAAHRLRKAMFDEGVAYECNKCSINEWHGQRLVLEIDHIDGQYWNNQLDNLQFLCPNCHSMKKSE